MDVRLSRQLSKVEKVCKQYRLSYVRARSANRAENFRSSLFKDIKVGCRVVRLRPLASCERMLRMTNVYPKPRSQARPVT